MLRIGLEWFLMTMIRGWLALSISHRGCPDDDAQYESKKHHRDGNRNRNWTEGKYRVGGKNGNDTEPDMIYYTY